MKTRRSMAWERAHNLVEQMDGEIDPARLTLAARRAGWDFGICRGQELLRELAKMGFVMRLNTHLYRRNLTP